MCHMLRSGAMGTSALGVTLAQSRQVHHNPCPQAWLTHFTTRTMWSALGCVCICSHTKAMPLAEDLPAKLSDEGVLPNGSENQHVQLKLAKRSHLCWVSTSPAFRFIPSTSGKSAAYQPWNPLAFSHYCNHTPCASIHGCSIKSISKLG
jgi:hypothetical protein